MSFFRTATIFLFSLFLIYPVLTEGQSPNFELRGAWIATVANIDWPATSRKKEQKAHFEQTIRKLKKAGLNTVFVQVRPAADAFYRSKREPFSEWLEGRQGKKPWYDPLKFMIKICRENEMEFHAWINPYRAVFLSESSSLHRKALVKQHPEWVISYGKGKVLNPGIPEVRDYLLSVIKELCQNYDLDGLHLDDYFYPYPYKNQPFPDSATFVKYAAENQTLEDWRRENVNKLIRSINQYLSWEHPEIMFGVSPFGVWRNQEKDSLGSATYASVTAYDSQYADVRKWLKEGWLDYALPQIYWSDRFNAANYDTLLNWWDKNAFDRPVYSGHAVFKVNNNYDSTWFEPDQLPNQIRKSRNKPNVKGQVYFSSSKLLKNPNSILDSLQESIYTQQALVPPMDWKEIEAPSPASFFKWKQKKSGQVIRWKRQVSSHFRKLIIYQLAEDTGIWEVTSIVDLRNPKQPLKIALGETSLNKQYRYSVILQNREESPKQPSQQKKRKE